MTEEKDINTDSDSEESKEGDVEEQDDGSDSDDFKNFGNKLKPKVYKNFKEIIHQYIKLIKDKMNSDEFIFLKRHHPQEYQDKIMNFVPEFRDQYPSLFQMIISGVEIDMSILDIFLNNLADIDEGKKTLDDARNEMGHMLHNKYVKDKLR